MKPNISLAAMILACAFPAAAQMTSSTITNNANGRTSITGSTGEGTVSSSGVVVNPEADRALLGAVVSQLSSSPAIQGAQIDVQVVGGRVTLNGVARDTNQVEAAKSIAATAAGGSANVASNLTTSRQ